MADSEQSNYYYAFRAEVSRREMCRGDACSGWILSEVDTWHECPCNAEKCVPHPESEFVESEFEAETMPIVLAFPEPVVSDDSDIPF